MITLDADEGLIDLEVSEDELAARARRTGTAPASTFESGYIWKYAQQVGAARTGAVTHPGGAAEGYVLCRYLAHLTSAARSLLYFADTG